MDDIAKKKKELRSQIIALKKKYTQEELDLLSEEVLLTLELTDVFQQAKNILLYNSLPDEVSTSSFIQKWKSEKVIYLPIVQEDTISFRKIDANTQFEKSDYGILEPIGADLEDFSKIDLIIIPGVAFDRSLNRLGRGKAYYDRFLKQQKTVKVGICFDFQLLDAVPTNSNDVPMDYVISENDLIWH